MSDSSEEYMKEVNYHDYCHQCKYWTAPEDDEHCDMCLGQPYNFNSRKPVEFVSAKD